MRFLARGARAAALFTSISVTACHPPNVAVAPTVASALGKDTAPLVVDWPAGPRGDLEAAAKQGVAVVRVDPGGVSVISDCRLPGSYGFLGVSRKEQILRLDDAVGVAATLPLRGPGFLAELGGDFGQETTLDVALVTIGKRRTPRTSAPKDALVGSGCAKATHFVRGFDVGAFVLTTSAKSSAATVASLFKVSAKVQASSGKSMREADGDLEACGKMKPGDDAPPAGCAALLRLEIKPIDEGADVSGATCPPGLVRRDGTCEQRAAAKAYECAPGDEGECRAQCDAGDAASCGHLAYLWRRSPDKASDHAALRAVAEKGCDGGSERACVVLGQIYQYGNGVPQDLQKAAALFGKACDAGEAYGCHRLGSLYDRPPGLPPDALRAYALYDRACRGGFADGCNNLGAMVVRGKGTKASPERARAIYEGACSNGSAVACGNLGELYADGLGGDDDLARATELWGKACVDSGVHCLRLADHLARDGKESERARELYQRGAKLLAAQCEIGNAERCADLGWMFHDGKAVTRDDAEALVHLRRACSLGYLGACNDAGSFLERGWGAAKDLAGARKLYDEACSAGEPAACFNLASSSSGTERNARLDRACQGGVLGACMAVARADRVAGRESDALKSLGDLCEKKHGPACAYLGRNLWAAKPGDPAALAKLDRACTLGDLHGCASFAELELRTGRTEPRVEANARSACDGGVPRGCYVLADLGMRGASSRVDPSESWRLIEGACEAGELDACLAVARATREREPSRAMAAAKRACSMDDFSPVDFLRPLALGLPEEEDKRLAGRAVDQGPYTRRGHGASVGGAAAAAAVAGVAGAADVPRGPSSGRPAPPPEDPARTSRLSADAADAGEQGLAARRSGCFLLGEIVEARSPSNADGLFLAACDGHDGRGCTRLALRKRAKTPGGDDGSLFGRLSGPLLDRGCEYGDGAACLEIGLRAGKSLAIADRDRAPKLFSRACDLGSGEGCYRYGESLLRERDEGSNRRLAMAVLSLSCTFDEARGCMSGARLAAKGWKGTPPEKAKAAELRQRGCKLGDKVACALK